MLKHKFFLIYLSPLFVSATLFSQEARFKGYMITDTLAYIEGGTSTYNEIPYLTGQAPGFTLPEFTHYVQPKYPLWELSERIDGVVTLKALILKDGKIQRVVVEKSAHKGMSRSAIEAILESTFRPAEKDSVPIDVWMRVTYRFKTN